MAVENLQPFLFEAKMNTDTFFTIGRTHTICQDYVEKTDDCVIVSDGCSAVTESNLGSILLSRAAKILQKDGIIDNAFANNVLSRAVGYAQSMELNIEALTATLLIAKTIGKNTEILVRGDGVVAARCRNTLVWHVYEVQYTSGAPFYLRYYENPDLVKTYLNKFGANQKINIFKLDCTNGTVSERVSFGLDNLVPDQMYFAKEEFDAVAIFSDGASSFRKLVGTNFVDVPLSEILTEFLNFKNYAGEFVKRRCKAAFKKFSEENCHNTDDFSIGVIYHQ